MGTDPRGTTLIVTNILLIKYWKLRGGYKNLTRGLCVARADKLAWLQKLQTLDVGSTIWMAEHRTARAE